jgi:hypothetical protein
MAVICGFHNKQECLSLNTRLGWKGLPGTNTLAYYGNRTTPLLRPTYAFIVLAQYLQMMSNLNESDLLKHFPQSDRKVQRSRMYQYSML